jgi:tetratricopeptide (TPR) repeat protein
LEPKYYAIILERIASCFMALKDLEAAEMHVDDAIRNAESSGDNDFIGYFYGNRARIASKRSELDLAIALNKKAYEAHKAAGRSAESATSLNNLAQCYYDQKRFGAARRTCMASMKISKANDHNRSHALSLILLGEIDELESRPGQAEQKWNEAVAIAKRVKDKKLTFKAEFFRFRHAVSKGDKAIARAIKRRLKRLAPWIPKDTFELHAFSEMVDRER